MVVFKLFIKEGSKKSSPSSEKSISPSTRTLWKSIVSEKPTTLSVKDPELWIFGLQVTESFFPEQQSVSQQLPDCLEISPRC